MAALRNMPHYTSEDYRHWEGKWELWNGTAVAMSPAPALPHARFSRLLLSHIGAQMDANDACNGCDVFAEIEWELQDDIILRPDVSVVCGDLEATRIYAAPHLVIEILSPRTHLRDRNEKRELYREHGVGRYLLADPRDWSLRDAEAQQQPEKHRVEFGEGCSVELPISWKGL